MALTNVAKPTTTIVNPTDRVVSYETFGTLTTTFDTETRTFDEMGTTWSNIAKPTTSTTSTPAVVTSITLTGNDGGWGSYTVRNVINTSGLSNTGQPYTRVRFTAASSSSLVINTATIQTAGVGDAYDFSATPVSLTFNNGSASATIPAGESLYSDLVTFTISPTTNLVIAAGVNSSTLRSKGLPVTVNTVYYKSGQDTSTVNATGYTNYSGSMGWVLVDSIESAFSLSITNTAKPS